jgi:hypothetical protein
MFLEIEQEKLLEKTEAVKISEAQIDRDPKVDIH